MGLRSFLRRLKRQLKGKPQRISEVRGESRQLYTERLGNLTVDRDEGRAQVRYERDGTFDYQTYREIQSHGNKLKLDAQWVQRDHIGHLAGLVKKHLSRDPAFGICHGTRRGAEQAWFREALGGDVVVIGTEIADSAKDFPDTVQWDFHDENPEWSEKADFVYSNSWDHAYDPSRAFSAWIASLAPGGLMLLDWTPRHSPEGTSELDPFGIELDALVALLEAEFGDVGDVVERSESDGSSNYAITTIVFRKN